MFFLKITVNQKEKVGHFCCCLFPLWYFVNGSILPYNYFMLGKCTKWQCLHRTYNLISSFFLYFFGATSMLFISYHNVPFCLPLMFENTLIFKPTCLQSTPCKGGQVCTPCNLSVLCPLLLSTFIIHNVLSVALLMCYHNVPILAC